MITFEAVMGTALPYAIFLLVIGGAWMYFNVYLPWKNKRKGRKAWDIHAR